MISVHSLPSILQFIVCNIILQETYLGFFFDNKPPKTDNARGNPPHFLTNCFPTSSNSSGYPSIKSRLGRAFLNKSSRLASSVKYDSLYGSALSTTFWI